MNDMPERTINTELWRCIICKYVLAMVENKKTVYIKRKDMYVEVEAGKVTVNCYRCGKRNTLQQNN